MKINEDHHIKRPAEATEATEAAAGHIILVNNEILIVNIL
jgi:hypothetical protein